MMHAMMVRNRRRFRIGLATTVITVGGGGYWLWPAIEARLTAKTAAVATEVLTVGSVQKNATELAANVTTDIMDNPATIKQIERLVVQVAESAAARDALRAAIIAVMQDPETQKELKVLISILLDDPEVREQTRIALADVFSKMFADKGLRGQGGDYIWGASVASITPGFLR